MWEPFNEGARRTIVRSQEIAQMFASSFIGTEHIAFALAEGDDEVGRIVAGAIDRDAMREALGAASNRPTQEMVFTPAAKRSIELAFENARRLSHRFIAAGHLALGVFQSDDKLPVRAGTDLRTVFAELDQAAGVEDTVPVATWKQTAGPAEPHAAAPVLLNVLRYYPDLQPPGTQVSVTVTRPGAEPLTWTWTVEEQSGR
jgi:ATP-dependent Clp protease ATP-binding subunit ClpA